MSNMIAELRELIEWNSFAASLVAQYDGGKALSERQRVAARSMLDKLAANKAAKAEVAKRDLSRVHAMFDAALSNGLKRPTFRFGNIKLSLASSTSRNYGAVYVKLDGNYHGKVQHGAFVPFDLPTAEAVKVAADLDAIAADPLGAAVKHGRDTGNCACCGRLLTDPESVARGVGPICAAHWGII